MSVCICLVNEMWNFTLFCPVFYSAESCVFVTKLRRVRCVFISPNIGHKVIKNVVAIISYVLILPLSLSLLLSVMVI